MKIGSRGADKRDPHPSKCVGEVVQTSEIDGEPMMQERSCLTMKNLNNDYPGVEEDLP